MCPRVKNVRSIRNLLALLVGALLFAGASAGLARAQQMDTLRIGGDYEFMTMKIGDTYKECRRACNNDRKCKAWTFIKEREKRRKGLTFNLGPDLNIGLGGRREIIPAQCRLKYSVGEERASNCCISGVKKVVAKRRATKEERCTDYAEQSIEQQDKNLSKQCDLHGNLWHGSYRKHYRWCMKVNGKRRNARLDERTADLKDCGSNRRARNRQCEKYADTAMTILEEAKDNKCGDKFPSWSVSYNKVYDWCLDRGKARRQDVMEAARANLASCIKRGGGVRVTACEDFADKSLEQIARAEKNKCDMPYHLQRWSDDYKVQYRYCRKASKRARRTTLAGRDKAIERCITEQSSEMLADIGRIELRQRRANQWYAVTFKKRMNNPVVVLGPASFNEATPVHGRIRKVTSRGFEFKLEEFDDDDGHAREVLSYMAIEKGKHRFKGLTLEAGTVSTSASMVKGDWKRIDFAREWRKTPVVFSQTQSYRGSDPVITRMRNIDQYGFEVALSEKEADRRGHTREVIGYVAIKQGRTALEDRGLGDSGYVWVQRLRDRINSNWTRVTFPKSYGDREPALFAQSQSSRGPDTFDVRYRGLGSSRVRVILQEEQSRDRETKHTGEALAMLTMPYGKYWTADKTAEEEEKTTLSSCREYGRQAAALQKRSKRTACGFRGRHWTNEERTHRRWCRRNGLRAAGKQLNAMNDRVGKCERKAEREQEQRARSVPVIKARFQKPELMLKSFGRKAGGWNNRDHVRRLADVNGDGSADIVGFGNRGVYVSLNRRGRFSEPELWLNSYGRKAGGWNSVDHERTLADVDGDGSADIVGFGNGGVYVSLYRHRGFDDPELWLKAFGRKAGGWNNKDHVRTLADVNGDGRADIVGFASGGVFVSLNRRGRFADPELWLKAYGRRTGGWNNRDHERRLADVNGDGRPDIVGFGSSGVYVSINRRRSFSEPKLWLKSFGRKTGGWNSTDHERRLADVNGDGRADIVGFGAKGTYVSLSRNGRFDEPELWLEAFGRKTGGWNNRDHERTLADVNGDGNLDVVGFGSSGVYVAYSNMKKKDATPQQSAGAGELLGCMKVAFRKDTDTVSVGRSKGAFSAIKLKAKDISVTVDNIRVVYGNDKAQSLDFRGKVTRGTSTSSIDLAGKRRFIKSITFSHKSKVNFGKMNFLKGGGKLCVTGIR